MTSNFKTSLCLGLMLIGTLSSQTNPHEKIRYACQVCHRTTDWQTVVFRHDITGFALEGFHVDRDCRECHDIRDFSGADRSCRSCHDDVHRGRLTPECERCHTSAGWIIIDPNRAHANTNFQLLGQHASLDCGQCHHGEIEGEFLHLSSDCVTCHREDYLTTMSPVHSELNFSQQCDNCHSPFAWQPANYVEHNQRFPIYTGSHAGEWNDCSDCHITTGNYGDFSCLNCHAHNQSRMDARHASRRDYRYESSACYSCHHQGKGDN